MTLHFDIFIAIFNSLKKSPIKGYALIGDKRIICPWEQLSKPPSSNDKSE